MDSNQKETGLHAVIFKQWVTDQKHLFCFHFLFFILYNSVLLLSHQFMGDLKDLMYLDLLYVSFLFAYMAYTYLSYHALYSPLLRAISMGEENILFYLPEIKNPTTRLIHQVSHSLYKEHMHLQQQLMNTLSESEDYASVWAHEIKSPLSIISMNLQTCDDPQLKTDLLEELERVQHLVEQSLNFNRSTSFSKDLLISEVAPFKLLTDLLKKHARILIAKQITVELQPYDGYILSDKKWLSFVLEQLLVNAIKYSPPGKSIRCFFIEDKSHLSITLSDEGIGILPEDLGRVFDRGFTGQNGRDFGTSTGMGLFLAKRITDNLGHSIHAESLPMKGSRFTVIVRLIGKDRLNLTRM